MTSLLPNPFVQFPIASVSTMEREAAACVGDASQAAAKPLCSCHGPLSCFGGSDTAQCRTAAIHHTPLPPEPVADFVPDEDFMDRLYASIVGESDAMPIFLRKPSPQFMHALFRLANG